MKLPIEVHNKLIPFKGFNWVTWLLWSFTRKPMAWSMAEMLTDIDRDAPKEEYIKYCDYCMRVGGICDGKLNTPNYDSWLRGSRGWTRSK